MNGKVIESFLDSAMTPKVLVLQNNTNTISIYTFRLDLLEY